jgi:glutamine amidotransferase
MTGIIDYGAGNLKSVENALDFLGEKKKIISCPEGLDGFDRIILPGVGAFGPAKRNLDELGFTGALKAYAKSGKPLFGICLGMQMLFDVSYEDGQWPGLGLIGGSVRRFEPGLKIPHMGWNALIQNREDAICQKIPSGAFVYFVHSYYVDAADKGIIAA